MNIISQALLPLAIKNGNATFLIALSILINAIIVWNTVYLTEAT
jgi:TnpA family transposase